MTSSRRAWSASSAALAVLLASGIARAADDPSLEWWTIHTPHARVHYDRGLEPIAERVADVLEGVHEEMTAELGWSPSQITEVVLTDNTDSANGSATAIPYNTMRLFVTAPDDMSALGDYDDWYLELVSHEYTHILHTDTITGVPAIVNAVVGRRLVPNQSQPRWLLEGLAVIEESRHTSGGRMRSSMFDMFLRADVLDDRLVPLDQISNSVRRWPQGNIWYLYGSRFLGWIADIYGPTVLAAVSLDSSAQVIPFGVNRSIRRATGRTYVELYEGWAAWLRKTTAEQMAAVEARGLREGTRITWNGQQAGRPRFVPPVARTSPGYAELIYHSTTTDDRAGFYRVVLDTPQHALRDQERLVVRTSGPCSASFEPDGDLLYNSVDISKRVYAFGDLMRLPAKAQAPTGMESAIQRLTDGARARDPDVSPDGRSVVYTVTHKGTSYLKIASITPEGAIADARTLVPSARFEQAYTPRYSPDGQQVAYSAWTRGGYRDIRLVDLRTGRVQELMHDRATDMQPSFSSDGRWLLYTSDRTGIANVFAYDLSAHKSFQVTNVRVGAFQPELSPDRRTLIYTGYTSYGFDLYSMPFDPARFLPMEPSRIDRPDGPLYPQRVYEKTRYNPLPSLRPRAFSFRYGPGTYGQALTIQTQASDAVGHHAFAASMNIETEEAVPYATLSYVYGRLPFNYFSTLFRSVAPRKGYVVSEQEPLWLETTWGWTNGLAYTKARAFDAQTYVLSYSLAHIGGELPVVRQLDPYATIGRDPLRAYVGVMRLGWSYSNAEQYVYSVGPERGFSLSATVDVGNEMTASEYDVYAFGYQATRYTPMPWLDHHVLAMHVGGATATGNYPRRGLYYTGGFFDTRTQDLIYETVFQSAFVLRGYEPVSFIGTQYHLANLEYRFPIVNVDHGISTVPFFLQRISGNAFLDYGGAFNQLDVEKWRDQFHTGVGGELWVDLQLGYHMMLNVRLGYAKGYGQYAVEGGQKYMVLAAPF